MQAILVNTRRALGPCGFRKTLTASAIASTPVSEVPPLANARNNTSTVAPMISPLPWWTGTAPTMCAASYCGKPQKI